MGLRRVFVGLADVVVEAAGKPVAFALALGLVLVWAVTGPLFGFSETWQLVINTGTTIVTFLMVFLLQNAQNRDSRAIQTKLNELILASDSDNRFVGVERMDDEELRKLSDRLIRLAEMKQAIEKRKADAPVEVTEKAAEAVTAAEVAAKAAETAVVASGKPQPRGGRRGRS